MTRKKKEHYKMYKMSNGRFIRVKQENITTKNVRRTDEKTLKERIEQVSIYKIIDSAYFESIFSFFIGLNISLCLAVTITLLSQMDSFFLPITYMVVLGISIIAKFLLNYLYPEHRLKTAFAFLAVALTLFVLNIGLVQNAITTYNDQFESNWGKHFIDVDYKYHHR